MKKVTQKIVAGKNLSHLRQHMINKWVALSEKDQRVLAVGKTLLEVSRSVADQKAVFYRVPHPDLIYSPAVYEI